MRRVTLMLGLLLVVATPTPSRAKGENSIVTIVHGLPRFTADIYVNGDLLLSGFRPEEATDPMKLPAGDYQVEIRDAGSPEDSPPALAADLTVPGGKNLSVIAHLDQNGDPTVSVFDNNLSRISAGESRLLLRHQAQAPRVDLVVDGKAVIRGVASGEEGEDSIPAARHQLNIMADGQSLVSPTSLELEDGTAYYVYLIGSSQEATLDLMIQPVTGLESAPSGVATGDGGLAGEPGFPWGLPAVLVAAVLILAIWSRDLARGTR
jgi:hypothetical protein